MMTRDFVEILSTKCLFDYLVFLHAKNYNQTNSFIIEKRTIKRVIEKQNLC